MSRCLLPLPVIEKHILSFLPLGPLPFPSHMFLTKRIWTSYSRVICLIQYWWRQRRHTFQMLIDPHNAYQITPNDVFRFYLRNTRSEKLLQFLPEKCINIIGRVQLLDWLVVHFPHSVHNRKRKHIRMFFQQLTVGECQKCLRFLHKRRFMSIT